jgi:hypothetical protein
MDKCQKQTLASQSTMVYIKSHLRQHKQRVLKHGITTAPLRPAFLEPSAQPAFS